MENEKFDRLLPDIYVDNKALLYCFFVAFYRLRIDNLKDSPEIQNHLAEIDPAYLEELKRISISQNPDEEKIEALVSSIGNEKMIQLIDDYQKLDEDEDDPGFGF